jgi:hypothetical protein
MELFVLLVLPAASIGYLYFVESVSEAAALTFRLALQ